MQNMLATGELLFGEWKWHKKAAVCVFLITAGVTAWTVASTVPTFMLALGFGDLLKLGGLVLGVSGVLSGVIHLVAPFLDRLSARHALFIGLDQHRVVVRGSGKLSYVCQNWDLDGKHTFSDSDVLLADGVRLQRALDNALTAYGGLFAPTIIILPFWRGRPFHLRSAEKYVVNEAARDSQALNAFVIGPSHALYDPNFLSRDPQARAVQMPVKGVIA